MGGKFDFQCKYCYQSFQHKKTLVYHCIKVSCKQSLDSIYIFLMIVKDLEFLFQQHKESKPVGLFEECSLCDKFFKRKGELKQHMKRKHKQLEFQNW